MTEAKNRFPGLVLALGLGGGAVVLLVAAYLPAMQGRFLMDAVQLVVGDSRPLVDHLWALENEIFRGAPRSQQAVGLALHALNALLVWRLLLRLAVRGAAVAALLFAFHPVQVESAVWIGQQATVLSAGFFFATLLAYSNFARGRSAGWYAAALALFAAALLADGSAGILPVVLLLAIWFRRCGSGWRAVATLLPLFVMPVVLGVSETAASAVSAGEPAFGSLAERGADAVWAIGFQAAHLLVPAKLAAFYPSRSLAPSTWIAHLSSASILAALVAGWLRRETWGRPVLMGVGWYVALLTAQSGLFCPPVQGRSPAADHLQYAASVGPIALAVHAVALCLDRLGRPRLRPVAALCAIALLWALTWQRSHVFASDALLVRDAKHKYPTSELAFWTSGELLLKRVAQAQGDPEPRLRRAVADLEQALSLDPGSARTHGSLGTAYALSGRWLDARRHLEIAVETDPANLDYRRQLAAVYEGQGDTGRALAEYRAVAAGAPGSLSAGLLLARALVRMERLHEGIGVLERAIERGPSREDPQGAEIARQARQLHRQTQARIAAAAAPARLASSEGPHWDVLLVTVDTLRPDYLSWNGYDLQTSPNLDRLLGEGFYFEKAVAPVPRTTPALASLVTGAYPHETGVRSLGDPLPDQMVTLAEAFQADGYQTFAVVTNLLLGPVRGLDAGFAAYDADDDARDARRTTDRALDHLERADAGKPLFAWVHYIDPHVPYHPQAEIAEDFDSGYAGRFRLRFGRQPRRGEPDDLFQEFPAGLTKSRVTHRNALTERENEHIRRLYAGDIRMLDDQIGRLVRAVRARFPDTVIVFTADHGESLGEHDFFFDHGDYVYNAASRVPLGFVLPSGHPWHGAGRLDGWVSLVDVPPTVFELTGLRPPPEMSILFEGRSLAPALRGEAMPAAPVFVESGTSFFPHLVQRRQRNDVAGRFRAVVFRDWKLIWTPFLPDSEAWELYDLGSDPHETRNLYRPDHPQLGVLRPLLEEWVARVAQEGPGQRPISDEDREALRALGYVE